MSFRRRTYPEVRDNVLTALIAGVAAEEHAYPPEGDASIPAVHRLKRSEPAQVISVYGSVAGQPYQFEAQRDFRVTEEGRAFEWTEKGQRPDEGSVVSVNYLPKSASPAITDLNVGSVVRTVSESFSLEVARLYAQLEAVQRSGFIDSATGRSLDHVVALLGIERIRGGRPAGEIELSRAPGGRGQIVIPAGTRVITVDGSVEYESVATAVMAPAQATVTVGVRDTEQNDPVEAGELTVLPVPIAGIASVSNPSATAVGSADETDEQLRTRAKSFLHGSERATVGAVRAAIERQGVSAEVVEPPGDAGLGRLVITLHAASGLTPEQEMRVRAAVEDSRPAGVRVEWAGIIAPRRVNLTMRLVTPAELVADDLRGVQKKVRDGVGAYFASLAARESASLSKLVSLAMSVPGVQDARITKATWETESGEEDVLDAAAGVLRLQGAPTTLGELRIADPNLATRVNVVARYPAVPATPPPDEAAIRAALSQALASISAMNETEPPSSPSPGDVRRRTLTFARLVSVTPLPGHEAITVEQFDELADGGPVTPNVAPYTIEFVVSAENGVSRVLSAASAEAKYGLTPLERLTLAGVQVAKIDTEGGGG